MNAGNQECFFLQIRGRVPSLPIGSHRNGYPLGFPSVPLQLRKRPYLTSCGAYFGVCGRITCRTHSRGGRVSDNLTISGMLGYYLKVHIDRCPFQVWVGNLDVFWMISGLGFMHGSFNWDLMNRKQSDYHMWWPSRRQAKSMALGPTWAYLYFLVR